MTDPMELVKKLEAGDVSLKTTRAAAACIREMVEERKAMRARLYRWEPRAVTTPMLPVGEHKRCNKVLVALGQAYPRTCFVCRLGPCRDEIIPHNLPPAPGAEDE